MSKKPEIKNVTHLAQEYSQTFNGVQKLLIKYRPAICPFDDILAQIPKGARLFDIGCGSGFLLFAAGRSCHASQLYGVEATKPRAETAHKALGASFPDIRSGIYHAQTWDDWPEDTFDVVTMIDVLHHVPPKQKIPFLKAALKRVRPGGRIIFKDMACRPIWYAWANRLHDLVLARQWITYTPIDDVLIEMERAGLTCEKAVNKRMGVYAHEMLVCVKR